MERRSHKKVRTGCDGCKQRHIKCDESGPPCMNCHIRGVNCSRQPRRKPNGKPQSQSQSHTPDSVPQSDEAVITSTAPSRLLELELMHTWTIDTFRTLSISEEDLEFWQMSAPREALEHGFLLNGILAITALHVSCRTSTTRSRSYQLAAMEYQNSAIAAFHSDFKSVTATNHQAVFGFSIINMAIAMTVPPYVQHEGNNFSVLENMLTTFRLLRGLTSIFAASRPWTADGPFREYRKGMKGIPSTKLDTETAAAIAWLKEANNDEYNRMQSDVSRRPIDTVTSYQSKNAAIAKLEENFLTAGDNLTKSCLRWLSTLPEDFIEAVINRDPLAMLVIMHWAILLDRMKEDRWWAKSCGKLLVAEISLQLRSAKPQWEDLISWVHESVGLPGIKRIN